MERVRLGEDHVVMLVPEGKVVRAMVLVGIVKVSVIGIVMR